MATYTDLHNRVKENITVDYNSRITPQAVRFLNENNEYWGTLKGNISAEDINIDGGTLKNVKLENIELCGSVVLGEVDISRVAKDIKQLSLDFEDTKQEHNIFKKDIGYISGSVDTIKDELENKIDSESVKQEIITLSTVFDYKLSNMSAEVSSNFKKHDIELKNLSSNLGTEVWLRNLNDEKLTQDLSNINKQSIDRDNYISSEIDAYKIENKNTIDTLHNTLNKKIETDKHYKLVRDTENILLTDSYPYTCFDFSTNIYKPAINDGDVIFEDNNGTVCVVGEIFRTNDDTVRFKTYNDIKNSKIS
jgi:hypothetical protein